MDSTPRPDRTERLAVALESLHRSMRTGLSAGGRGLTRVQWLLLRSLQAGAAPTVGLLADRLGVRSSTMSQMLDRLEKEGWIRRAPGTADSRVRQVALTPEGQEVIEAVSARALARLQAPLSSLSQEEQEHLLTLLERVAAAARGHEEVRP